MSYDLSLTPTDIKQIMSKCVNLTEISFSNSRLSSESTEALIRYLPSTVLKLNLAGLRITDKNIEEIVNWCKKIVELDLCGTRITLKGVICIVNNLSKTLVSLWLPTQIPFTFDQSPNLLNILYLATNLKNLWWKSNELPSMAIQKEKHHLKKFLPHLTINEFPQNIADPSIPYGKNGIWEIECKPIEIFPSYLHTEKKNIENLDDTESLASVITRPPSTFELKKPYQVKQFAKIKLNDMYLRVQR